jgi:hypothetical protein
MDIEFVTAPSNYTANDFKSVKDIMNSGATVTSADALVNMPVVPTGSHLQHPQTMGTNHAPIDPVLVWYDCVEVWTYVFEVSNTMAASHFASTRTQVATGRASGSGFDIAVTPDMRDPTAGRMNAIPLWHVNQYSRGVTAATSGGPSPTGMRNVSARREKKCASLQLVASVGPATLILAALFMSVLGYQFGSSRRWLQSIVATVVGDGLAY